MTTTTDVAFKPVGDRGKIWRRRIAYAVMIGYAMLMFVPFAWSVITSFKTLPDSVRLTVVPAPFTLQAWTDAFTLIDPTLPKLFFNSFLIAAAVTVTNLVLGSAAGYAFARLRFPGREILFLVVLGTLMIPDPLRLIPVYLILNGIGLTKGTLQYGGVILVLAISGTSIFLLRQYFLTIPRDLEEAAKIDGAGFLTIFARVILPLAGPALSAVAILQFQGTWNSFFWPLVILQSKTQWTLPLGINAVRTLSGGFGSNWPPFMAIIVAATIPILILYIYFQRYFVEGIAASGVKG